jgi:hypothetical protein
MRPDGAMVRLIVLIGLTLLAINALGFSLVSSVPLMVLCSCIQVLLSGALVSTARGAFAQTFRSDYQALAFGLFGAVQRVSQGLGVALSPLASAAGGNGATAVGIAAMGVMALSGVPLFSRWRPGVSEMVPLSEPEAAAATTQELRWTPFDEENREHSDR